jgi:hypothetical protein
VEDITEPIKRERAKKSDIAQQNQQKKVSNIVFL